MSRRILFLAAWLLAAAWAIPPTVAGTFTVTADQNYIDKLEGAADFETGFTVHNRTGSTLYLDLVTAVIAGPTTGDETVLFAGVNGANGLSSPIGGVLSIANFGAADFVFKLMVSQDDPHDIVGDFTSTLTFSAVYSDKEMVGPNQPTENPSPTSQLITYNTIGGTTYTGQASTDIRVRDLPEPASMVMLGIGMSSLFVFRRLFNRTEGAERT